MTSEERDDDKAGRHVRSLSLEQMLASWQAWSEHALYERAARRAEAEGDTLRAEQLRAFDIDARTVSAIDALAAQHHVSRLLAGWEWQTVGATREAGSTWTEIARAVGSEPAAARAEYLSKVDQQEQLAVKYGGRFGMTADEAQTHRDLAGQWFAELHPDTPDHVVEEIQTAIVRDDTDALDELQYLWWDPSHRRLAQPGADEPILSIDTQIGVPDPGGEDDVSSWDADADASAPEHTPDELAADWERELADPDRKAAVAAAPDQGGQANVEPVADVETPEVVRLECPECGEDAVESPETVSPHVAHGQEVPRYAHPDGAPLCPVVGPSGGQPAQPREVLADPLDETARRAQLARWHGDDHAVERVTDEGIVL